MTDEPRIDAALARHLIDTQFPEFTADAIRTVAPQGWDNRSFRLGSNKILRLPSALRYATQPEKEWRWLPHISDHVSTSCPIVLGQGQPDTAYPYHWSVLSYVDGDRLRHEDANAISLATDLAQFLAELRATPDAGGPRPGQHNFHRGGDLRIYDQDLRRALAQLGGSVDSARILTLWRKACTSAWTAAPVWLHGDVAAGNLLQREGRLCGVIDFGCCAVGDPACDLTIAWTFFEGEARDAFVAAVDLDPATWDRARGWALWKAVTTYAKGEISAARLIATICEDAAGGSFAKPR